METEKRSKPGFLRNDWHKKIKLGRHVKKNRKWRNPIGIHSKVRLNIRGHSQRPRVGWGSKKDIRGKVMGLEVVRVENVNDLKSVGKGQGAMIANVGLRKRKEIIAQANKQKIKILNKYKESKKENATR